LAKVVVVVVVVAAVVVAVKLSAMILPNTYKNH
jgi:hypothetical protein